MRQEVVVVGWGGVGQLFRLLGEKSFLDCAQQVLVAL